MTEETNQLIGKMLSSMEHNTKLTEKISDKVDNIDKNLSALNGKVDGHDSYLKNLDDRIVTQRAKHEELHAEVTVLKTKAESNSGIFKWVLGIIASIVGAIVTLFITNK